MDLPLFGNEDSAVLTHVSKYYVDNTSNDIGIPSIVAAILAGYRGYDTLGETTVILIAGIAVLVILSRRKPDA
jgi:multicomponent Na+:H+ antiporter subunit B